MTANPELDVSIILVCQNVRKTFVPTLESIAKETARVTYEIIAVDCASADGTRDALAAHPMKPRVISLPEDAGFGRAANIGSVHARGRYLLFLAAGSVVRDGAVDELIAFAEANKRALIWAGRGVFAGGRADPYSCVRRISLWTLVCRVTGLAALFPRSPVVNSEYYGGWQRDTVRQVDIVSRCFFLMRTSVWTALGGFSPAFATYGEDADLCLRARRIGAQPTFTPHATIVHPACRPEWITAEDFTQRLAEQATLINCHWHPYLQDIGRLLLSILPLTHWLALRIAGLAAPDDGWSARAELWRDVWKNRYRWRYGYTTIGLSEMERALVAETSISALSKMASPTASDGAAHAGSTT